MAIIEGLRNWTMEQPGLFGIFHITFLVLIFLSSFLLIKLFRDSSERIMKRIVFISWIVLVVFEIGKQVLLTFSIEGIHYSWGDFPLQFCETPLYVIPVMLFTKNNKVKNAIIAYMATYVFFAGFALTILPLTMYSTSVFMNIRTMIQHGLQVILGVFLFAWNRKNITNRDFVHGMLIFFGFTLVAITYNFVMGIFFDGINMFWIAKDYPTHLSILKYIKPYVPYTIFVICYLTGFSGCALGSFIVEKWVHKLCVKHKLKQAEELEFTNEN